MAQLAEFEEKEYEQPLNIELLLRAQNNLWSPGQVLERHFGFDCALLCSHGHRWSIIGYPSSLPGVVLNDFSWGPVWRLLGSTRMLPTFKTNLLLQIKRPEHRQGRNTTYARLGIPGQYWQFPITEHQQEALEQVSQRLRNRMAICYASAAFHTLLELYDHQALQRLVNNSSFVQIHRLSGHNYWLYNQPGSTGIAHSKPEAIKDTPLESLLTQLREGNSYNQEDALKNIIALEEGITSSMTQGDFNNPIVTEFIRKIQIISAIIGGSPTNRENLAAKAFLTVSTFCSLTKTNWFVVT